MSMFEAAAGGRAYSISNNNQQEEQLDFYKKQNHIPSDHSQTSSSILSQGTKGSNRGNENIRVCVRVRPVLPYERNRGEAIYYPARHENDNLDVSRLIDDY